MRPFYLAGLSVLFALFANGCANIEKQIETIKPTASIVGARMLNINFDRADLVFDIVVTNSNPFSLRLDGLDYDFRIEDQSLVSGVSAQGLKINKSSSSKLAVPVTLKFDDLSKLPGKLQENDQLAYRLNSRVRLDLPVIGHYSIPFSRKGELPVPKLPSVNFSTLKVSSISLASANVVANIEVDNPNGFDLGLSDFNFKLRINQQTWGEGVASTPGLIPRKASAKISIPVKLNFLEMGKDVYEMLNGDQRLNYQLSGGITVDTGLDFLRAYRLPINMNGTTILR